MVNVIGNLSSTPLSKLDNHSFEIQKLSDFLKLQSETAFKNDAETISSIEIIDNLNDDNSSI